MLCGLLYRRFASVRDRQARPFGRERNSGRAADAAAGSGDKCSLAFKAFRTGHCGDSPMMIRDDERKGGAPRGVR